MQVNGGKKMKKKKGCKVRARRMIMGLILADINWQRSTDISGAGSLYQFCKYWVIASPSKARLDILGFSLFYYRGM